jgi:hypothetical protein
MDEAFIGLVCGECRVALGELPPDQTLSRRLRESFACARRDCYSIPKNDQFRGAILAVYELASTDEKRRIDDELKNIEALAAQMGGGGVDVMPPILKQPIGLTELWKEARP